MIVKITNEIVVEKAKQIGFDLVGFTKSDELTEEAANLEKWLELKYHGDMDYMERYFDKRKDVSKILPDVKSIISLGMNYYTGEQYSNQKDKGKISRYAWGKDYHLVIWEKLDQLDSELKEIDPEFESKSYVDTGPVMDKAWAVKAGLGWLAKHTNVLNKEIGSWFFIANLITNYEFENSPVVIDHCGSCRACIDACPTNAIVREYLLDSTKCISYLTIENKKEIPDEFKSKFDNWIFGCDICQDVCPWNIKFSEVTKNLEFFPKNKELKISEVYKMSEEEFHERFSESPINRTKLMGLKRNVEFIRE
ncbi:MAG: tRNA epoxyqueuosine(34) reductase QueG [Ignavibacteria bacterium RBG_16_34_14]|nr:MAG: tRNA epoxyqueuosine(34) reductase QueG [Ignavibacteria bacterium RBG_16_34_14]